MVVDALVAEEVSVEPSVSLFFVAQAIEHKFQASFR
jgi:hypothetical protein